MPKLDSIDKLFIGIGIATTVSLVGTILYTNYRKTQFDSKPKSRSFYDCRDCELWNKKLELEYENARKSGTLTRYFPDFQKYHEKGHKNE